MENTEGGIKRTSRLAVFEHVVEKEKNPKRKKFRPNRLDLEDSSPSESELIIDDEPVKKKRQSLVRLSEERLHLTCEWSFCEENFDTWESFNTHLIDHATSELENFKCQWKGCDKISLSVPLLIQHISYHGYLTKLKSIGQNMLDRNNLPRCTQKEHYYIPLYPEGYTCEWEYCSYNFCTVYDFFTHMEIHVKNNPRVIKEKANETIMCCWQGCNSKYSSQYKLAEHLRTHTKEKTIACPTCCTLFASKTKFYDHRKRQLATNLQSYQCSQCLKLFPSERLLRDHIRSHINHYKCTMCDMTCPKPSILAKHIRFKHVKEKPFKCTQCTKTFVAKHNLVTHLKTHSSEKTMKCEQCNFQCRTKIGLDNHYAKAHDKHSASYECHCCKQRFRRGGYLTKHLMKVHNYHWPSGHSRFRYRKDQDNIYRLQTVRYESLEVTQEMIRSESMQSNTVLEGVNYTLKYDNDGQSHYILSVSENGEQSVKATKQKDILITINDVDEDGNIVRSEVVESREVVGPLVKSDEIVITEHTLQDITDLEASGVNKSENDDEQKCVKGKGKDILEKAKSGLINIKDESVASKLKNDVQNKSVGTKNSAEKFTDEGIKRECIKVEEDKSEVIRHFSSEAIANDSVKIETPNSAKY